MYFISYNDANDVTIAHHCKPSQKNIGTIAWTGIVAVIMVTLGHPSLPPTDLGQLDDEEASPFQEAAGLSKFENFINEVLDDAASIVNSTEEQRQKRI
ncbi:hypothetical protein TNCV_2565171 [Trichonephila clavipes]|uniref:Uncharacterized protein n=1 Tax=Trichonephila clavipes TaxID=2585209 RepID=A0A8X6VF98_TRICX|nr:hypothetical protein TNCV_2565171 [Trichonephila clavipes]